MTEPLPERGYWTIKQVSAFVGVPKKSVYKWPAQYPTMPVLAMGTGKRRTWLFPIERFQRWLRDQEQGRRLLRRQVLASSNPAANGAAGDARRPVCVEVCADMRARTAPQGTPSVNSRQTSPLQLQPEKSCFPTKGAMSHD